MKRTLKIFSFAMAATLMASACQQSTPSADGEQDTPQFYSTADEAVAKAKADLLSILESDKNINLNIEGSALRDAQPGKSISYSVVDFNKLGGLDSLSDIKQIVKEVSSTIVPLVNQGNVVTIVEVSQGEKGWKVSGLGNAGLSRNINAVLAQPQNVGDAAIELYEVPNLRANLYVVKTADKELFYTDYNGYSIRESVNPSELLTRLKSDAEAFIKNYGDKLKDGKLVE
ncbi:MAG TPA: hypothetical protein VGK59_11095 [Ohtaekwangia sp.]